MAARGDRELGEPGKERQVGGGLGQAGSIHRGGLQLLLEGSHPLGGYIWVISEGQQNVPLLGPHSLLPVKGPPGRGSPRPQSQGAGAPRPSPSVPTDGRHAGCAALDGRSCVFKRSRNLDFCVTSPASANRGAVWSELRTCTGGAARSQCLICERLGLHCSLGIVCIIGNSTNIH